MKKLFGMLALMFAMLLMPGHSSAESCNPRGGVCVGTPTGTPCGHLGQSCCNVNGYDYNCVGSTACNPGTNTCWPSSIPCEAECYSNLTPHWVDFYVSGSDTVSQVAAVALSTCLSVGQSYVTYTCSYY